MRSVREFGGIVSQRKYLEEERFDGRDTGDISSWRTATGQGADKRHGCGRSGKDQETALILLPQLHELQANTWGGLLCLRNHHHPPKLEN